MAVSRPTAPYVLRTRSVRLAAGLLGGSLLLVGCSGPADAPAPGPTTRWVGEWRAWLDSPGGELPFGLSLRRDDAGQWSAQVINGDEHIAVPGVTVDGQTLRLSFDHYDSAIEATRDVDDRLNGRWTKTAPGADERTVMDFHARREQAPRFGAGAVTGDEDAAFIAGRWAVDFETEDLPCLAELSVDRGRVLANFQTPTGDYRFLEGTYADDRLRLSVFDGAHAFLFDARVDADGTLSGDFWSRDTWHETWSAVSDPDAEVPDPFAQTHWVEGMQLGQLSYPDLDGNLHALDDPAFAGAARLVVVVGSWCPNCADATRFLVELDDRYRDRGLSILGLAFEHTGDFERDAAQVRKTYVEHHGVEFPMLVAGTSDKDAASRAFPLVDRVRSFPTTLFIDARGDVRWVHSGFSGPATGPAHERLREAFGRRIETLLAEAGA